MKNALAFLRIPAHLIAEEGFSISIFFVAVVAAVLAFGLGAASEIVSGILILGLVTALVESKLRARK